MADTLIIENLNKSYKDFALKNINLRLEQGTVMGLVGENGAGKTTLIKCILNLVSYDTKNGSIQIFGMDSIKDEVKIKKDVAAVFDQNHFPEMFNARDIADIMRRVYPVWDSTLFNGYLSRFNLPDYKPLKDFSRGMKMKLNIAAAMSHRPKLLLLDEATSGLDPIVRDEILEIFRDYMENEECSILISSHITSDLEKIADSITFMHDGQVTFTRNKDEMTDSYGILKIKSEDFEKVPHEYIVSYRVNKYSTDVLINNRAALIKDFPDWVIDVPSIEEVLLFQNRGNKI